MTRTRHDFQVLSTAPGHQWSQADHQSNHYVVRDVLTGVLYDYDTFSDRWQVGHTYRVSAQVTLGSGQFCPSGRWLNRPRPVVAL